MVAMIEVAYLYYWGSTFFACMDNARTYQQRALVTAAMIALFLRTGHFDSKELVAGLCGLALAIEVWCFVCNFLDLDERLFPRKERI